MFFPRGQNFDIELHCAFEDLLTRHLARFTPIFKIPQLDPNLELVAKLIESSGGQKKKLE
jgi:hypothetical protein